MIHYSHTGRKTVLSISVIQLVVNRENKNL